MSRAPNHIILWFEDDDRQYSKLQSAVAKKRLKDFVVRRFMASSDGEGAYEDRLVQELRSSNYGDVRLIVCDRDLSTTKEYPGLSEAVVSKVANNLGVPICLYARGIADSVFQRQEAWGDGRIVLDCKKPDEMANKIVVLAKGFVEVANQLNEVLRLTGDREPKTPAEVVAAMLGDPGSADKIALYASGDQKMVSEILPFVKKNKEKLRPRVPMLIGYWLYDSILRFPGLFVNRVAAASYLNIAVADFMKDLKIQELFKEALYKGPFADKEEPLWWRAKLDDIRQDARCSDGQELVEKKLKKSVKPCLCSVDKKSRAGWYCVVTEKPVSLDNSKGNITWFPRGADLSRIRKDVYEEIGPWLGLY